MEKSLPHSIEKQTGCFLKQLKRSVSLSNDKNDSLKTGTSSELIEIAGNSLNESQLMMAVTENQNIYRERTKFNEHMIDSQILAGSVTSTQTEIFQSPTNSPVHSTGVGYRQHSTHATPSKNSLSIAENTLRTTLNTDNLNFLLKPIGILQMADTTNNEVLNIASVADLLHPQYAIITGGRSADGCPLIIFPDNNNFCSIEEADYQKLVSYLASVTSLQEADLGFNLIVDRRKDRWSSVRTVLQRISEYFPGIIHVVYVIRPSGLFQKALSEVSNKFSRDEYRFRLVVCSTVSDLHDYIHISQLTPDMGGYLIYSHHEWIQQRISLENFSTLTHNVSTQLDVFMKAIHDIEFPNSVEATNKLLENQTTAYECLKVDIFEATKHGEELLFHIKSMEEFKDFFERIGNISAIERLLVQLEETDLQFDEFWRKHQDLLGQCLHLRIFEQDFRKMQSVLDGHIKTITEFTENGESVERVATLIQETEAFFIAVDVDLKMGEDVMLAGQHLIRSQAVCPWEAVQPKCDELKRVCDLIRLRLDNRLSSLAKNKELMERIEKANLWCTNGVDLLASQRLEKCSVSMELAELEAFISTASDFKLTSPSELKRIFLEGTTPETKALVAQVLQRIDDVSLMCDKRIASLKKLSLKPTRPVLQVSPEPAVPLQPPRGAPYLLYPDPNKANDKQDWRTRRSNGIPSLEITDQQNQQDTETRCLKRGHVLKELLETERIYVNEMGSILKGYSDRLKSEVQAPASLQGKEDILFGNLKELYRFHCEVFLKDLENCISATELVALCFVQRRDTFYQLYSFYCQNIPRSERLRETLVDTHIFLQECQKRLGHKLPLAAYLLKPVQRITKYQLLLKDLLRFSDSGSCSKELQKALDCMLIVLKCVNDSMHQVAITGFPGDVAQQGELLMQDSFQVWTESKKDIRLRIKPQQRHIFLYQKSMLFCKETLKPGHNKSTYQFKNHVKMSQIGLTESVRGDTKRFEVWLQGRQEVHTLQAPSVDIKQKWVAEIKRVLFNQLEELKGEKIKQYGINQQDFRQTTFWDSPSNTVTPTNHTIYVETLPEASNLKSKCSSDFFSTVTELSDKDQQQNCSFSLECSNSEEELAFLEESSSPGDTFVVLADYSAMTHSEVAMREGDTVELLKVGCAGWWYVRTLDTNAEGWAPAAYMEHLNRKSERVLSRHKERINFKQPN